MSASSGERMYSPALPVLAESLVPRVVEVATTTALETTAPVGSVMVPLISPLPASCADAKGVEQSTIAAARNSRPESRRVARVQVELMDGYVNVMARPLLKENKKNALHGAWGRALRWTELDREGQTTGATCE